MTAADIVLLLDFLFFSVLIFCGSLPGLLFPPLSFADLLRRGALVPIYGNMKHMLLKRQ